MKQPKPNSTHDKKTKSHAECVANTIADLKGPAVPIGAFEPKAKWPTSATVSSNDHKFTGGPKRKTPAKKGKVRIARGPIRHAKDAMRHLNVRQMLDVNQWLFNRLNERLQNIQKIKHGNI